MKLFSILFVTIILTAHCSSKPEGIDAEKNCSQRETVAELDRFHANIYAENSKVYFKSISNPSIIYEGCDVPLEWLNGAQTEGLVTGLLKSKTTRDKYQQMTVISISWISNP